MNSPIIILVLWFVINIIVKSVKDKQKIEAARRKRTQQLGNKPIQQSSSNQYSNPTSSRNTRGSKNIIELLKEEIEKEVNKEKEAQRARQQRPTQSVKIENRDKANTSNSIRDNRRTTGPNNSDSSKEDISELKPLESSEIEAKTAFIDMRKDLLKGIIMSEILSEPKSIKNIRRSM